MADIAVEGGVGLDLPPVAAPPAGLSAADRRRIGLYFAGLIVLLGFPENLMSIPISFFLKNKLHLAAHQVAVFFLIAAIPVYFAFAFGFIRDIWSPFGSGDRGFIMLSGAVGALACVGCSLRAADLYVLLAAALIAVGLVPVRPSASAA